MERCPPKFVVNVTVLPSGTHFQATVGTQTAMGQRNILVLGRKLNGTFGGKHLCFRCPRAICHSCLCVSYICWPCVFNWVGLLIWHNQLGFKYFDYLIYIPKQLAAPSSSLPLKTPLFYHYLNVLPQKWKKAISCTCLYLLAAQKYVLINMLFLNNNHLEQFLNFPSHMAAKYATFPKLSPCNSRKSLDTFLKDMGAAPPYMTTSGSSHITCIIRVWAWWEVAITLMDFNI